MCNHTYAYLSLGMNDIPSVGLTTACCTSGTLDNVIRGSKTDMCNELIILSSQECSTQYTYVYVYISQEVARGEKHLGQDKVVKRKLL